MNICTLCFVFLLFMSPMITFGEQESRMLKKSKKSKSKKSKKSNKKGKKPKIINLKRDLTEYAAWSETSGAQQFLNNVTAQQTASRYFNIRAAIVMERGRIVFEYYRGHELKEPLQYDDTIRPFIEPYLDGTYSYPNFENLKITFPEGYNDYLNSTKYTDDFVVNPNEPENVHSVTKTIMAMLIGHVIESEENELGLNDTLGDVFGDLPKHGVSLDMEELGAMGEENKTFVMNTTIYQLLTMTSGLVHPIFGYGSALMDFENATEDYEEWVHTNDQTKSYFQDSVRAPLFEDLTAALTKPLQNKTFRDEGTYEYLNFSPILSYVIKVVTGYSPREYLNKYFLKPLGIKNKEIDWWKNEDRMESGFHGLHLTARQMAKFGQLLLQEGKSGKSGKKQIVSKDWIKDSTSFHVPTPVHPNSLGLYDKYGYLTRIFDDDLNYEGYWADGHAGHIIAVNPKTERVYVQLVEDVNREYGYGFVKEQCLLCVALSSETDFMN